MKTGSLDGMVRGWFVGDFEPTLLRTQNAEVGVKTFRAGESEACHVHHVATELTVVLEGEIRMAGVEYRSGDIAVVEPGEHSDFLALTDARLVCVKVPGAKNDKYDCTDGH